MQEPWKTWVRSLGGEDPLEEEMATHSSILAWEIPYEELENHKQFEYFDLPDTKIDIDHIKALMQKFLQYEQVHVYYGKFGNVIKQSPMETSITGENIFETENLTPTPRED